MGDGMIEGVGMIIYLFVRWFDVKVLFFFLLKMLVYICNNLFVCEMVWCLGIIFIMFYLGNEIIIDMIMRDILYILSD